FYRPGRVVYRRMSQQLHGKRGYSRFAHGRSGPLRGDRCNVEHLRYNQQPSFGALGSQHTAKEPMYHAHETPGVFGQVRFGLGRRLQEGCPDRTTELISGCLAAMFMPLLPSAASRSRSTAFVLRSTSLSLRSGFFAAHSQQFTVAYLSKTLPVAFVLGYSFLVFGV